MNIILLSGGSGKRLWPLSNEIQSKQFLKIYKMPDGSYESMVQRVYRQIKSIDSNASITLATSKSQVSSILNQLGDDVNLSVEPCRRDTFPAIALAVAYLHDVLRVDEDDTVSVCPVDHYVDVEYYRTAEKLSVQAKEGNADLVLMGIEPTEPSDKYGYIIPATGSTGPISTVSSFKEKPDVETAKKYIEGGALWNAGVFAFKLSYVLNISKSIFGTSNYHTLLKNYNSLTKISFDYAVVEKAKHIQVMPYSGTWRDIGSWSMLTKTMTEETVGDVMMDDRCESTHIINNLDIPVLAMGLKGITVAAGPDGILVASKTGADEIKTYVEKIDNGIKYAEKSWGVFRVIDVEEDSITIKASLDAGDHMNYHSHEHRDEVWTIVSGNGMVVLDGKRRDVGPGDVIRINRGVKHTIMAVEDLVLIEVQMGKDISVKDKVKYEMPNLTSRPQ